MQNILITGAAGFIGRQLVEKLNSLGNNVIEVDNLSVEPLLLPTNSLKKINVQDITSAFLIEHNVDIVIHLAAKKNVHDSFYNLENSIENYEMTIKLFNACVNANVNKIFLASTCEIFGYQEKKLDENSTFKPYSPYAVTKVANEYLSNVYMMYSNDLQITSLNFFNTYGPSEGIDAVIPNFINKAINNKTIIIEGDGNQARDFTFIDDTINLLINVINSDKYHRYLNIGSGFDISVNKIAMIVKSHFPDVKIENTSSRPNEIKTFIADNSIIIDNYDFLPKINIEIGIKKVIDFHLTKQAQ
jgi:nucleoside-diphosphate-sugar epimerase